MQRLIELPIAEAQLIAAIAAAPAGQKLSIPKLRDALLCQADVLNALSRLVAAGKLDRATLRPPARKAAPPRSLGAGKGHLAGDVPAAPLAAEIRAFCAKHKMPIVQFSRTCLGAKTSFYNLEKPGTMCRARTLRRIRAFIDNFEPARERAEASGAVRTPEVGAVPPPASQGPRSDDNVASDAILTEIQAFLAKSGMSPTRFGKDALNNGQFINRLSKYGSIRAATAARIRRFIANYTPPADPMPAARREEPKPALAPRFAAPSAPQPDPTQPPPTPLMDAEERQRIAGKRQFAQARRTQEQTAAAKLDAGKAPANSFERATMNNIRARREEEARQADPVEQAKLALQRKGRVVHSATIHGGRRGYFMVGGQRDPRTGRLREISPAELLDLAEKATGQSFRRVA